MPNNKAWYRHFHICIKVQSSGMNYVKVLKVYYLLRSLKASLWPFTAAHLHYNHLYTSLLPLSFIHVSYSRSTVFYTNVIVELDLPTLIKILFLFYTMYIGRAIYALYLSTKDLTRSAVSNAVTITHGTRNQVTFPLRVLPDALGVLLKVLPI